MDLEINTYVVTLIGTSLTIFLGWLLNELSSVFRDKQKNRRLINRSLYSLLELKLILDRKKSILDSAAKIEDMTNTQFKLLQESFYDEKFNSDEFRNKVEKAIENLAELDPILTLDLTVYADSLIHFEQIDGNDERDTIDKLTKQNIKGKHRFLKLCTRQIDFMINKLIRQHSLTMRIKYYRYEKKSRRSDIPSWDSMFEIGSESD